MRIKFFKQQFICFIIFSGFITAEGLPNNWATYWQESGQVIISDQTNQWILGTAALGRAVGRGFRLNDSKFTCDNNNISLTSQLQLKFTIPL